MPSRCQLKSDADTDTDTRLLGAWENETSEYFWQTLFSERVARNFVQHLC